MKIKSGFTKRNIAGADIVVPVGDMSLEFNGMITLKGAGGFLWDCLKENLTRDELVNKVLDTYDIDKNTAETDVDEFIELLKQNNLLDE